MKKDDSAPQIIATLKHGKVFARRNRIFFWACLVCAIVATVAFVTGLIIASCLPMEDVELKEYIIVVIATIIAIAVSALLIFVLSRDKKYRREVNEWLADAIRLMAFCEECDKQIFVPLARNVTCVGNIKVTFNYEGDKKVLRSNFYPNIRNGTGTVFARFVGKEVLIMYSPKYEQVMFIDDYDPWQMEPFEFF